MRKLIPILMLTLACSKQESSALSIPASRDVPAETQASGRVVAPARSVVSPAALAQGVEAGLATAAPNGQTEAKSAIPRMIVRTADVKIIVADTSKTIDALTRSVEASGGYVSGSSIWREGELLRARLTLRVPAGKLTETLASIRGLAKRVQNETIASEDVSQEFVDLESQVRNLEATETELRELLKVARVNSKRATDVLEVHEQLTLVRGQIEQAKGRMRYLSQVTDLSAINLELTPDAIAQPVVEPGWQPVVVAKSASRALVVLLQNLATGTIWFLIYILPILGMLLLGILALVRLAKRSRTREA
ncbi:MAG: DUF4349 domain-containing protein [Acidobacteriota bacterium]